MTYFCNTDGYIDDFKGVIKSKLCLIVSMALNIPQSQITK